VRSHFWSLMSIGPYEIYARLSKECSMDLYRAVCPLAQYSKPSNLGDYHSQSSSRLRSVFSKQPRKASIVEFWGVEGQIVTRLSCAFPDRIMPRAEYYQ
jgi:hypothetical protein